MNTEQGLAVQDSVSERTVSARWLQITTVVPSWDQESAAKTADVAFRTVLEEGSDTGQRLEVNLKNSKEETKNAKEDHKFSAADLGLQSPEI